MKAKRKPLEEKSPAAYGIEIRQRLRVLKTEAPASRQAGIRVSSVDELLDKLRNEARVL